MTDPAARIADNARRIEQRIAEAAARGGRRGEQITVVAVTKYVDDDLARACFRAGLHDLGESRPQQLWSKAEALAELPVRWHLVGHLQRNKIRRTLPLVRLIHGADSVRLLDALNQEARQQSRVVAVLLEVNVSGDVNKHGFRAEELAAALPHLESLDGLEIRGLMAMAGLEGDMESARRDFIRLRQLRDRLRGACPPAIRLEELSMGMSGDFEVAVEEGATIVRIGSAFFEGINE